MVVSPKDLQMDYDLKYKPEAFSDICREPEPPREVPPPPSPQLFNIEQDPLEERDLATAEPERTAKMLRELEIWFEEVETDRRSVND